MAVDSTRDRLLGEKGKGPWTRLSGMPFNERVKENEPGKYREAEK